MMPTRRPISNPLTTVQQQVEYQTTMQGPTAALRGTAQGNTMEVQLKEQEVPVVAVAATAHTGRDRLRRTTIVSVQREEEWQKWYPETP